MQVQSLDQEEALEEGMATHSNTLAWKIPLTENPGGYSPWGPKEPDMTEGLSTHTRCFYYCNNKRIHFLQQFTIHLRQSSSECYLLNDFNAMYSLISPPPTSQSILPPSSQY